MERGCRVPPRPAPLGWLVDGISAVRRQHLIDSSSGGLARRFVRISMRSLRLMGESSIVARIHLVTALYRLAYLTWHRGLNRGDAAVSRETSGLGRSDMNLADLVADKLCARNMMTISDRPFGVGGLMSRIQGKVIGAVMTGQHRVRALSRERTGVRVVVVASRWQGTRHGV